MKVASPPVKPASAPVTVTSVKVASPPVKAASPPMKAVSPPVKTSSPPTTVTSPLTKVSHPFKAASPPKTVSPPKNITSPPVSATKFKRTDSKVDENSVIARASKIEAACSPPNKEVTSPPVTAVKVTRSNSKEGPPKVPKRENSLIKEAAAKIEQGNKESNDSKPELKNNSKDNSSEPEVRKDNTGEESVGVGDKIKKFEKAAEVAAVPAGRLSRPGSVRRSRLPSDPKEEFPPPATPFKDNVHFELPIEKETKTVRWQRSESHEEKPILKPEPKIVKPEFKSHPVGNDLSIRSPGLAGKLEHLPSQGTAFRNVASPDQSRNNDPNNQNFKSCKFKPKKEYSVSKGSSYFTRGSEEIWLVKKKDIEEIEERVLDSFRRAGGNVCMRSESMRPASDSGQGGAFSHATMGRNKRQMYARSESLDPQWAGNRAQTLKRQTSVACTCGHDKKPRAKSVENPSRPRAHSNADDSQHVLDKYETLV